MRVLKMRLVMMMFFYLILEQLMNLIQDILKPLDVAGHGTIEDRLKDGEEIAEEELELMERAEKENSVIIAQMTPFFEN